MAGLLSLAFFSSAFVPRPAAVSHAENKGGEESFLEFLSQFRKVDLPYAIGLNDLEGYQNYWATKARPIAQANPKKPLWPSRYLPGSEAAKFSRMGPPDLFPVARFYPNNKMVAVIYSSKLHFGDKLSTDYLLMLYDLKGNMLTQRPEKNPRPGPFLLAFSSPEKSMTATIDADGNIGQLTYENQWKKDVRQHGYVANSLTNFKLEKTAVFHLDGKGNFVEPSQNVVVTRAAP